MKKCNFCAEEIQDEAIKCKHCGSEVKGSFWKKDAKNMAQGIKKVGYDQGVYQVAIFFSGALSAVIGFIVGGLSHNPKAGWVTFGIFFFVLGGISYNKYLKA